MFVFKRNFCFKVCSIRDVIKSVKSFSNGQNFQTHNFYCVNPFANKCSSRKLCSGNADFEDDKEKEINIESITNGDKDMEHKLRVILLEAEVLRQEGKPVPPLSSLSDDNWRELLALPSRSARSKFFIYLFKIAMKKKNKKARQLEDQLKWEEKKKNEPESECNSIEDFVTRHDLKHNSMFLRIYDTTINQMYNNRLIQAIMFGQKLVVDCGYDVNMTNRENMNCAKQLMLLFAENRLHDDPFDLYYSNMNKDSLLFKSLHKFIPTMNEPWFPLNIHESSYLDLFPKDQLVYLTPHCQKELTDFDHNAVYIIGGIVDKVNNVPLSLAKAKREGLKMAKFPLDRYLQWGSGSGKSLTLNQVISILLDIKLTGKWDYALRHVPRRKIVDQDMDSHMNKSTDSFFNKHQYERKWVPISNINIEKLNKTDDKEKERLLNIKHIFND